MTDIIHGSPPAVPVDNPFFRWWQSIDQWTLVATLALIVTGLLLSMAASVPLADPMICLLFTMFTGKLFMEWFPFL